MVILALAFNVFSSLVFSGTFVENYRVSHSEMIDSEWLRGVEGLRIFLNYGS